MIRTGTLLQAAIDAGIITNNPSPVPQTPSNVEPPPTENEPEEDDDFDPRSIFSPRGAAVTFIEYIPPRDQLSQSAERQLAAFEALRAELGFPANATRPPAMDHQLVAALVERWPDDLSPYEVLRNAREHDPAMYDTMDFLHLMFEVKDRIVLRDGDDGPHHILEASADSLGPMKHSTDVRFQINPTRSSNRFLPLRRAHHVLLRFTELPELIALWVICQIPVWVRAVYRRPGAPVEALLEIDADTDAEFSRYVAHLGPHLAAIGADPAFLRDNAFSRLPVAQRNETIEDILYMDTRPIPADARPIIAAF